MPKTFELYKYIVLLCSTVLNIRITIYNFSIILCLFVDLKPLVVRMLLGPDINAAMEKAN